MTRRLAVVLLGTLSAAAMLAAPAMGRATVIRETVTFPVFETGLTDDCRPGLTGTLTGTGVMRTRSTETSTGFHIVGTEGGPGRIDWSDGSYTLIQSVDRFSFNAVAQGTTNFTETHVDSGDFYSADGVFQFRDTFHEVKHFIATNGVVHVDFEKGRFHFFGEC